MHAASALKLLSLLSASPILLASSSAASVRSPVLLPPSACKLPNRSPRDDVALGFPRIANRLISTGNVSLAALFVDFSDAPAAQSPAAFAAALAPAGAFYAAASRGALALALAPRLASTLRMPAPSTAYSFATFDQQRSYLRAASAAAVDAGYNFSGFDSIIVLAAPTPALPNGPAFCAEPGQGFSAGGLYLENAATSGDDFKYWGYKWLNHELSHTFGLVDLYSFGGSPQFGFTGQWGIMGDIAGAAPEFFGWERWLLGWIGDDAVACVGAGSGQRFALAPIEAAAGGRSGDLLLIVVPTGPTTAVAVEFRAAAGFDAAIPKPGLLVYTLDTAVATGEGPLRVLPLNASDNSKLDATLAVGESLVFAGVRVTHASDGVVELDVVSSG
jgi:M6 family metalloprotease-like protein